MRKYFSNLPRINTDRFDLSSDNEEHIKSSANSYSEDRDSKDSKHRDHWIYIKAFEKGLNNQKLREKIKEKLQGND